MTFFRDGIARALLLALVCACSAISLSATNQDEPNAPRVEGLQVALVAGKDRYLDPGVRPEKLRVGVRLLFGSGAPAFHPDMLGKKALKWVLPGGESVPLEPGDAATGSMVLPEGTILRVFHELEAPASAGESSFDLVWSWPGAESAALSFLMPKAIPEGELPDFRTATMEELGRGLMRFHVVAIEGVDRREELGTITFRLAPSEETLDLVRTLLTKALAEEAYQGIPIYHIQKDLFCKAGPAPDFAAPVPQGFAPQGMPQAPAEIRYERGDFALSATLQIGMTQPNRNVWMGQLLWVFQPMIAIDDGTSPYTCKVGEIIGDDSLLTKLSDVKTLTDDDLLVSRPVRLLVIDKVEYLSFQSE